MSEKYHKRMIKLRQKRLEKDTGEKWSEPIFLKGKLLDKYSNLINKTNEALKKRNIKYGGFEWTYHPKNELVMFLEIYDENRVTFLKLELFELPELKDIVIEYRDEAIKDMEKLKQEVLT